MNGINGYYGQQYQSIEPRRSMESLGQTGDMSVHGLDASMMVGGDTLDEIINQNTKEIQLRRTSMHPPYRPNRVEQDTVLRRASMMEFGSGPDHDLDGFQFDPRPRQTVVGNGSNGISSTHNSMHQRKARSQENLALDTRFSSLGRGYEAISSAAAYHSPLNPGSALGYDVTGQYMNPTMGLPMDFNPASMNHGASGDVTPVNIFSQANYQPLLTESPTQGGFGSSLSGPAHDPGGGHAGADEEAMMEKVPNMGISDTAQGLQAATNGSGMVMADAKPAPQTQDISALDQSSQLPNDISLDPPADPSQVIYSGDDIPAEISPKSNLGPQPSQFPNAYSSSGFDMLRVLMRIATRPKPEINIGAVDMSCAFVVCDITQHDMPIVYCSDIFERLTGYTKHEILGRNCRFLQAPDGKVQAGVKRKYVDDKSVLHLKNKISRRTEVQVSLINYRKGGQPFMNLLTMIPIRWDSEDYKYYVGFQVDLVEQPNSVTNRNPDGSYAINYQRGGLLPRYVLQTPETTTLQADLGQTIGRDEVSTVLSTIGSGESELSKRIWDKILLENTDDVVHVLSLKGLFLYLSPASRRVLEYDASELVGTALSSVCHPSDIVPVTRELKDTSTGSSINVVFRIRRKHSGYTWFESHGSLHMEQGKGRKCIILVGRERPVYVLTRSAIFLGGGIGESELWTKMSTSGMFLFVSSNVRTLLDRPPSDLIGTSIQSLMRADSKTEFGRILEVARTGKRASFKHEMQNRRGQVLQAQTTIYPGDAMEGSKPTFLVAQTRLLKLSRSLLVSQRPGGSAMSPKTDQASAGSATSSTNFSGGSTGQPLSRAASTPQSSQSNTYDTGILTQPGGSGLAIGNQDEALASEDNVFDELKTTRSTSWQFELRQMEKQNRLLTEELQGLLSRKKKRKRRKGSGQMEKDCANCHARVTPEWRRGPSGNRDLCNSCGLRWAKQNGRVSPRKSSEHGDKQSASSAHSSPVVGDHPNKTHFEKASAQAFNADSHLSKTSRMEAAPSHGFGGGIPAKIEEGVEPTEDIPATEAS